jgi:hypothetical protein
VTVFVLRAGRLMDKARAAPLHSARGAAHVIGDEMPATRHMATGEYFTSKAKFRQRTRETGNIEVGNEVATLLRPRAPVRLSRADRRQAIRSAIRELRDRG